MNQPWVYMCPPSWTPPPATSLPTPSLRGSVVTQSCPTLCDPMDYSPPGSTVHEIFQARILEWVAISFSRGSSQPRDWTQVSCTAGRFFTDGATRKALSLRQILVPSVFQTARIWVLLMFCFLFCWCLWEKFLSCSNFQAECILQQEGTNGGKSYTYTS